MAKKQKKNSKVDEALSPNTSMPEPFRFAVTGAPTKFEVEFCEEVVRCGEQGYSFAMMARHFGVVRSTLMKWADTHPAFSEALMQAREYALAWWEHQNVVGLWAGKEYNDRVSKFVMTNQFREEYRERVEVSGALAKINFDALTDDQLSRIASGEHPYAVLAPSRHEGLEPAADEPEVLVATVVEDEPSVGSNRKPEPPLVDDPGS